MGREDRYPAKLEVKWGGWKPSPNSYMTRDDLEKLLYGHLVETEDYDIHCPICGFEEYAAYGATIMRVLLKPGGDDDDEYEWVQEDYAPKEINKPVIVECLNGHCGFVADESFFIPNKEFPKIIVYDEDYGEHIAGNEIDLTVVRLLGIYKFPWDEFGKPYYELLQIVNAQCIDQLPVTLSSGVKWIRELAAKMFDKLNRR